MDSSQCSCRSSEEDNISGSSSSSNSSRWNLCRRPWWDQVSIRHHRPTPATSPRPCSSSNSNSNSSSSSSSSIIEPSAPPFPPSSSSFSSHHLLYPPLYQPPPPSASSPSVAAVAKAFLLTRRRLSFDPPDKVYFPYEAGKQATSAVQIKNVSHCHVAFKFQTTAPKSCFMRPPSGILAPGESIVTTITKFIEQLEKTTKKKNGDKFKIVSLKVKEGIEFTPELFEEKKELAIVERILRVHFLDPDQPSHELEKLQKRLAEVEATQEEVSMKAETSMKQETSAVTSPVFGDGVNALEAWNKLKLARQQAKVKD